jgi:hypothetical protein
MASPCIGIIAFPDYADCRGNGKQDLKRPYCGHKYLEFLVVIIA